MPTESIPSKSVKVVIFPLSISIETKMQKAIESYKSLGVNKFKIYWHYFGKLTQLTNQLRCGKMPFDEFVNKIRILFPVLQKKQYEEIRAAWNAMSNVLDSTHTVIQELQTLVNQGVKVYILANSNEEHISHIFKECHNRFGKYFPGEFVFSFAKEWKCMGANLRNGLLNKIYAENKGISQKEIVIFYSNPTGKPSCCSFEKIEYNGAKKAVKDILNDEQKFKRFCAVHFEPNKMQPQIISKLHRRGWNVQEEQISEERKQISKALVVRRSSRIAAMSVQAPTAARAKRTIH